MDITQENLFDGDLFDPYSFIHIINGFNISLFLELFVTKDDTKIFICGSIFHLLYEIKDFSIRYKIISKKPTVLPFITYDYSRNTLLNSMGDQIFHTIGYYIYLNIRKKNEFTKNQCIIIFLISNIFGYFVIEIYNKNTSKKN